MPGAECVPNPGDPVKEGNCSDPHRLGYTVPPPLYFVSVLTRSPSFAPPSIKRRNRGKSPAGHLSAVLAQQVPQPGFNPPVHASCSGNPDMATGGGSLRSTGRSPPLSWAGEGLHPPGGGPPPAYVSCMTQGKATGRASVAPSVIQDKRQVSEWVRETVGP